MNLKNKYKSGNFDTLVLSGGAIHILSTLGALQYCKDNYLINKISNYIGTSAGAICCYLLAIGYTPIEIMVYLCTNQILEQLKHFNLVSMINGKGCTSFIHIHTILEKMTIEKLGRLITLEELYNSYNKILVCVTYNITTDNPENLNYKNYPKMPCLIALRMSSNLPFIFEPFKYLGNYYVDGGICNNFGIDIGNKMGNKVLGILIAYSKKNFSKEKDKILDYIYHLLSISHNLLVKNAIEKVEKGGKCSIIKLEPPDILFFNFGVNTKLKLEMFSNGYTQIKNYFKNTEEKLTVL